MNGVSLGHIFSFATVYTIESGNDNGQKSDFV